MADAQSSVSPCSVYNTCMICLSALLVPNTSSQAPHDDSASLNSSSSHHSLEAEIGSVFPCGHVFHLNCFNQWHQHDKRCPNCNQEATLFCKLFLSAPSAPSLPAPTAGVPPPLEYITTPVQEEDCNSEKTVWDTKETAQQPDLSLDQDDYDERKLLLDWRTAMQTGHAQAIRKVVQLRSKVRKLRRSSRSTRSELESTKLVLEITQEELELTQKDLQTKTREVQAAKGKLGRIQTQHWERHNLLRDELANKHAREIQQLQQQLQDTQMELALKKRQLKKVSEDCAVRHAPPAPKSKTPPPLVTVVHPAT